MAESNSQSPQSEFLDRQLGKERNLSAMKSIAKLLATLRMLHSEKSSQPAIQHYTIPSAHRFLPMTASEIQNPFLPDLVHHTRLARFKKLLTDPIVELKQLKETAGIEEYHEEFEVLSSRVNLSEAYLVSIFLEGLRADTRMNIQMFNPRTIRHCLLVGRLYERAHPRKSTTPTLVHTEQIKETVKASEFIQIDEDLSGIKENSETTRAVMIKNEETSQGVVVVGNTITREIRKQQHKVSENPFFSVVTVENDSLLAKKTDEGMNGDNRIAKSHDMSDCGKVTDVTPELISSGCSDGEMYVWDPGQVETSMGLEQSSIIKEKDQGGKSWNDIIRSLGTVRTHEGKSDFVGGYFSAKSIKFTVEHIENLSISLCSYVECHPLSPPELSSAITVTSEVLGRGPLLKKKASDGVMLIAGFINSCDAGSEYISCSMGSTIAGGIGMFVYQISEVKDQFVQFRLLQYRQKKQKSFKTYMFKYKQTLDCSKATIHSQFSASSQVQQIWDPGGIVSLHRLICTKQLKLARSLDCEIIDRDLKRSFTERKSRQSILKYPPTRTLCGDERQLPWNFRFSLMSEKRALTKFLCCMEWSDVQGAKQAIQLMHKGETLNVCAVLELLFPLFASKEVRAYDVRVLERADDDEFKCYLLQLVQALCFECSAMSQDFLCDES